LVCFTAFLGFSLFATGTVKSLRLKISVRNAGAEEICPDRLAAISVSRIDRSPKSPHFSLSFREIFLPVNLSAAIFSLLFKTANTSPISPSLLGLVLKEVLTDKLNLSSSVVLPDPTQTVFGF